MIPGSHPLARAGTQRLNQPACSHRCKYPTTQLPAAQRTAPSRMQFSWQIAVLSIPPAVRQITPPLAVPSQGSASAPTSWHMKAACLLLREQAIAAQLPPDDQRRQGSRQLEGLLLARVKRLHEAEAHVIGGLPCARDSPSAAALNAQVVVIALALAEGAGHDAEKAPLPPGLPPAVAHNPEARRRATVSAPCAGMAKPQALTTFCRSHSRMLAACPAQALACGERPCRAPSACCS